MAGFFDDNAPPADWVDPGWTPQPAGGGTPTPIELGGGGYTPGPDYYPPGTTPSNPGGYTPPDPPPYVAPQSAPTGGTLGTTQGRYGPIQGFDTGKLNDTGYSSGKYTPAVRAFSAYLGTGGSIGRNDLGGAVSHAQANGFPNAKAVGDDKIDFGDGNGPIDVIQSNGSVWFQNGDDRFGAPTTGGGASSPAGESNVTAQAGGPSSMGPSINFGSFTGTPSPYTSPTWTGGDYQQLAKPAGLQNPYTLPTQAELEASPGYQSRLAAGLQARDRSAAAKGTVLNGGTQQALARYGQDYASNEYDNLVGQTMGARQVNYGEYNNDDANAFRNYQSRYGQFQDTVNNGRTDYALNVNTNRNAQNDYWSHLNDLYSTGAASANGSYKPGVQV